MVSKSGPDEQSLSGKASQALTGSDFSAQAHREKLAEYLFKFTNNLTNGNDIKPVVLMIKDGQPLIQELVVREDGTIELPDIKLPSKSDLSFKSKVVNRIIRKIGPILHADIETVTYVALMRKDMSKLEKVIQKLRTGKEKPRLENRVGCIYLVIGDEEFLI